MYNMNEGVSKGEQVVREYDRMKGLRVNWDRYWEELSEYFLPQKDNVYGYKIDGEQKHNRLYDSTSILALELLSSSFHGMLTNPSTVWFDLSTGNADLDGMKEVRSYAQTCVNIMIDTFNQSNFQEEIHEVYMDLGAIGTTVLQMEEDNETDIRFKSMPIYSSYIDENEKGVIDRLARCTQMTWRQIVRQFGIKLFETDENHDCMDSILNKPEQKEDVIFLIEPEEPNNPKSQKFIAYYVLRKKNMILKTAKYNSFPFAIPRWSKLNEEVYGRCPAMKALPDTKMLNAMMKTMIRGMQKVVDPPIMVPDNGFLLPIKTTPNGTNFYRTGMKDRIEAFPVASRPDIGLDFMENIRSRIREHFFTDQLQLIQQRDMTATEVMQRTDERLRFLGPILGRLNNELLKRIIDRTFDILERRGRFPKPPEALADKPDLKIVYTSQIAKAQRTGEANTLTKVLQATGVILEVQPDVFDNINGDEVLKFHARNFGLPEIMLKSDKEVAEARKARAEQQQAMMQAQQENMQADTQKKQSEAQQQ
jgi:hypothetical protein